jgi:hypothetical protein
MDYGTPFTVGASISLDAADFCILNATLGDLGILFALPFPGTPSLSLLFCNERLTSNLACYSWDQQHDINIAISI